MSGWFRRAGAWLVDGVIVSGPGLLVEALVADFPRVAAYGLSGTLTLAYFLPLMVTTNGRTLGKMATGIRVIRTDLRPVNVSLVVRREYLFKTLIPTAATDLLGWVTPALAVLGLSISALDYFWPLWDSECRAIHDMLARTRVVRYDRNG